MLGRPVEAGEKSKEACLRRRCRYLPQRLAGEAGRGDGGAIVFQRARQIDGMRVGQAHDVRAVLMGVGVGVGVVVVAMISTSTRAERGFSCNVSRKP
jgi:hypothetical protein